MSVVLARGRRIFNGASGHHHRRHSIDHVRRRDADPTQTGDYCSRHRSRSIDSSSSDSSISSTSSIRSTVSEPPEMPVPHIYGPSPGGPFTKGPSNEHEPGLTTNTNYAAGCGRGRTFGGPVGGDQVQCRGRGFRGRGFGGQPGPTHHERHNPEWRGACGGRGWNGNRGRCAPGVPSSSTLPSEGGGPREFPTYHDQKEVWKSHKHERRQERRAEKKAWRAEKRGMKYEHRRMKRAMRHEKLQRRLEARATRYGEESSRGVKPWKLIISYHGARRETGQS
jgi:hypothetical protein